VLLAGALVTLVLIVAFVAEPFRIPTESMEPTLRPGDQVLLNKLAYRFGSPHRGELAVFKSPDGGEIALKRIVGLPGDRVGIADGVLTVNGKLTREAYVNYRFTDSVYFGPITVPAGHVFVMGDNRADSEDSRDYGPVSEDALMGRVAVRLWPLSR
jgi:signal peptidase I